jgi:hypothetical protein
MEKEIDLEFARSRGFPLVRRSIGGGAILDGPWEQDYFIVVHRKSPRALNDPQNVRVYVDGAEKSFRMSPTDDSWQIVFDYSHSMHQVILDLDTTVVPEFPGFMILPLFMMATLLVTILSTRCRRLPSASLIRSRSL